MEQSIDRQAYSAESLVEIRVPLHMPYTNNQKQFEQFSGSIRLNGKDYNYIKRRIYNDTLILLCLPDIAKTQIKNARETYTGLLNDLPASATGKKATGNIYKNFTGEYEHNTIETVQPLLLSNFQQYFLHNQSLLPSSFICSPEQPPDRL